MYGFCFKFTYKVLLNLYVLHTCGNGVDSASKVLICHLSKFHHSNFNFHINIMLAIIMSEFLVLWWMVSKKKYNCNFTEPWNKIAYNNGSMGNMQSMTCIHYLIARRLETKPFVFNCSLADLSHFKLFVFLLFVSSFSFIFGIFPEIRVSSTI